MAHQNVANAILLKQGIINRQDRTAGIAEDNLNALIHKDAHKHLGSGQRRGCSGVSGGHLCGGVHVIFSPGAFVPGLCEPGILLRSVWPARFASGPDAGDGSAGLSA
ncbi:hypothetical protein AA21952_0051 [Acetobacter oeni LMG 21952]|nr:hypothetical protein AA21952_0051 [Acetobacter oeni LMG 21952]